ncbi:MAG: hypothetical protein AB7O97_07125 [Planctomycetota bacterium]
MEPQTAAIPEPEPATARVPPAAWSLALTVLAAALWLEERSRQVGPQPWVFAVVVGCAALVLLDFARRLLRPRPVAGDRRARSPWRWLLLPAAAAVCISATAEPWLLDLRFRLSREAFERTLRDVQRGKGGEFPRWVGLYHVHDVRVDVFGAMCFVVGKAVAESTAICYDPAPMLGARHRILGRWYAREL